MLPVVVLVTIIMVALWFVSHKGKTMLTIVSAKNPAYATADGSCISLMVKFEEFEEELPFGATPHDPHPYGVELYNRALVGEFGPIAPFVEPMVATQPQPTTQGAQTL
jgi:hypothetical protein